MIGEIKSCYLTHQFFRTLDLILPSRDELLLGLQLPGNVKDVQELIVEHFERNGDVLFPEDILIRIGRKFIEKDMLNEASMCFLTNTIQYPNSVESWEGLAYTQSLMGKITHALNFYSEALLIDPNNCQIEQVIASLSNQIMQM